MVQLSPGVLTREKDFSAYVAAFSSSNLGAVGTATRGPLGVHLVTSIPEFIATYGNPTQDSYGMMAAVQYLSEGNALYYRRVASNATKAVGVARDADSSNLITFESPHPGDYNIKVVISEVNAEQKTFTLTVLIDGEAVQQVYDVTMDPDHADHIYVEDALNKQFVVSIDETNGANTQMPAAAEITLTGGSVGGVVDKQEVVKALGEFEDTETLYIDMIAAPGWSEADVVTKLLMVAEKRADCLALIDTPFGLTYQEAIDWHNGKGTGDTDPGQALNSSYGALYWSWMLVYNEYTGKDMWVPPSGLLSAVIAANDREAEAWFAPAGFRRGRLLAPKAVEFSPGLGARDAMYGNKNAINPIVNFAVDGITVWGQRTLQRKASATDRVNVRRLLLVSRRAVADSTKYFTFEQNDEFTWNEWVDLVTPFFESIKSRRGLYDFKVIMDSTTVTPFHIDRNEMPGKIMLKPTKSAEFITIDFAIMSTGASFED